MPGLLRGEEGSSVDMGETECRSNADSTCMAPESRWSEVCMTRCSRGWRCYSATTLSETVAVRNTS